LADQRSRKGAGGAHERRSQARDSSRGPACVQPARPRLDHVALRRGLCLRIAQGHNAWGHRFVGKEEVARGLAARFEGIPDVHYGADEHSVCGNRGSSEWTISGTTVEGDNIEVRGCDLWTFDEDGKIIRKDSFWKMREST